MYVFGNRSKACLIGLHPDLKRVLLRAIFISTIDFTLVEGVRSDEQCYINYGQGRTAAQCRAGGCPNKYARPDVAKVTWLKHALDSNHRKKADGFGHAVDIYAYPITSRTINNVALAKSIADIIFKAAAIEKVKIRWGGNWDGDSKINEKGETDLVHFELHQ